MRKALVTVLLLLCCGTAAFSQITKVRGRVTDSVTGEGIPFAGIFFKGTTIGLTTDMDGYYILETRESVPDVLVCQYLGYRTQEKNVRKGAFTTVDFVMELSDTRLYEVVVKADNRKIKRLLAGIEANRARNNPENRPAYSCSVYNKMEIGLTHAREQLTNRRFLEKLGFVFENMDTTTVSGVPYLPAMISESIAERYHTCNPEANSETIVANRISGVNPDANLLTQFTGSMHLKCNFYQNFVNSFDIEFPSPIQGGGLLYYNYYMVDTLSIDSRKTYLVHYHPKPGISSPALDGEMLVDAGDFALRSIRAKMKHGGNVNWVRDIVIDVEYQRLEDSTWFYKQENLYADFSIVLADSSKAISLVGKRELSYSNPRFDNVVIDRTDKVKVEKDSNYYGDEYWEKNRPYALTEKEKNIYRMVDRVKETSAYKTWYDVIYTVINGYWDIGKIGLGPYHKIISFNNLEGARVQMGIHTSKDLSKKFRWTAYAAYGFKDRKPKGGLTFEYLFSKEPTRKLTLDAKYDVFQLGRGTSSYTDGNILASVLGKGKAQKLCQTTSFSACYEHEVNTNVNIQSDVKMVRYFANEFVPMVDLKGNPIESIASNELHLLVRFSKDETVNRGHFIKTYVHTNYPVVSLDVTGAIPGIRKGDYGFVRPELTVDWKVRIPPVGMSKIHFNAGTIIGKVPYPFLHLFEGNGTYILDKSAFSCIDFFEFASDSWFSLLWHHNFNGFFLGKIPLIKELKLREEFTFKAAYGFLSDRNNPLIEGSNAFMMFPQGMKSLGNMPYLEIGAGISNILQLFRVDCVWRLTHRESARQKFCVTVGLEFRF